MPKDEPGLPNTSPVRDLSSGHGLARPTSRCLPFILFAAAGVSLIASALIGVSHQMIWLGNAVLMTITMLYAVSVWAAHRRRSTNFQAALNRLLALRAEARSDAIIEFRNRAHPTRLDS